jgi:hypothetical protein
MAHRIASVPHHARTHRYRTYRDRTSMLGIGQTSINGHRHSIISKTADRSQRIATDKKTQHRPETDRQRQTGDASASRRIVKCRSSATSINRQHRDSISIISRSHHR